MQCSFETPIISRSPLSERSIFDQPVKNSEGKWKPLVKMYISLYAANYSNKWFVRFSFNFPVNYGLGI